MRRNLSAALGLAGARHNRAPEAGSGTSIIGWGVLVTWCLMVVTAFSILFGGLQAGSTDSLLSDTDARLVSAWLKASPDYQPGRTTVARIGTTGCSCDPMTAGQWRGLRARWSQRDTTLYEVAAPARRRGSLAHVEIAIADSAGRLIYAGAFDASPMCGGRTAMDTVVTRAHAANASTATPTTTSSCRCP